jgi:hypothetical protein
MAYKELSAYFSEDNKRRSTLMINLETKKFHVSVVNESGTSFTSVFDTEVDAEQFAEDWVML